MVPRLEARGPGKAWVRARTPGASPLDLSRPGRSEELIGVRPARQEDPWRSVIWSRWVTRHERFVRDYREAVPEPGFVVVDDRSVLLGPPAVGRFTAFLAFATLARFLRAGEPARLLTTSGRQFAGEGTGRLGDLADAVAGAVRAGAARGGRARPGRDVPGILAGAAEANALVMVILSARLTLRAARAVCEALKAPHLRGIIYAPVEARELDEPGWLLRGYRDGRLRAPAADYALDLRRHLDRLIRTGDRAGIPVEPLVVADPKLEFWEVLDTHWERVWGGA
jgi:hypothetical protein